MRRGLFVIALGILAAGCAVPRTCTVCALPGEGVLVGNAGYSSAGNSPTVQPVAHQEELEAPPNAGPYFSGPVPVEELVNYAVTNNPEIAAARAKADAALHRVPQVRSLDDPMLTTTAFLEDIQTAAGPQEAIVSLSQKFPWFGKLEARGEVAFHDAQAAFAQLADVELAVVEQVKLAYYDLYFIAQSLSIYKQLEANLEDVLAVTRTRYKTAAREVGLESVLQAEIALHKLQITMTVLEQSREKAKARLAKSLHLPSADDLDIQPQLIESSPPQQVDSLVAMLEYCHPQLEARRQAMIRDDWSVSLAHKDYYPDVNVGFNWHAIGEQGLSRVANGRDAYSLMVGVNLPIYQARRSAAMSEALLKANMSAHQYGATWDALREDVEKLSATAVEHDRVLKILDEDILNKSRQSFELSVQAYRVGRIGFPQLIESYQDLLRFRIEHAMRRSQREQAIAQLERAVGCTLASSPAIEP